MASSHGMLHEACKFCPLCLQAESPEQRAVAIESAAQAIQATQQWRQKRKFLSPQQLSTWEPLVRMLGLRMPPGSRRRCSSMFHAASQHYCSPFLHGGISLGRISGATNPLV